MRFTEKRGVDAIEAMADLLEPLSLLVADKEVQRLREEKAPTIKLVKALLKANPQAVLEILAIINDKDLEAYNPNPVEIMSGLVELMNTPEVSTLFFSQGQTEVSNASGSAMADTTADGK